jgi:hypothetical protein
MKKITKSMIFVMCAFAMMFSTNAFAFQNDCLNYKVYLADNPLSGDNSDSTLYGVSMSGDSADLTALLTRDYRFHLAYNNVDDIIYLVRANGTGFEAIDGTTLASLADVTFTMDLGNTPTGVYDNGLLYIGSSNDDKLYTYNFDDGVITEIADEIPVGGGDLIKSGNTLYLATRTGSKLHQIVDGAILNTVNIPSKVMGITLSASNTILMANRDSWYLNELDLDGNVLDTTIDLFLEGQKFTIRNGDMAGGCNYTSALDPQDMCEDFAMYYADIKGGSTFISEVSLQNNTAVLEPLSNLPGKLHISYDTSKDYIYAVDEAATTIWTLDNTGAIVTSVPLAGGLDKIVTNVYRNNKIYIGSQNQNVIVEVNILTGTYREVASNVPVSGGDLEFRGNELILATRSGNKLVSIDTDTNTYENLNADINPKVNGLALTFSGEYLVANANTTEFQLLNSTGTFIKTYNVIEPNGTPYNLTSGDLASGCTNITTDEPCNATLLNGSFEDLAEGYAISGGWDYVPEDDVIGWLSDSASNTLEIQLSGAVNGNESVGGEGQHFELNGDGLNTLYQEVCTPSGENLTVNFAHKKRLPNGLDKFELYVVGSLDDIPTAEGVEVISVWNEDNSAWETKSFTFDIPEGQTSTFIYFKAISGTNNTIGNLIDDVSTGGTLAMPTDMVAYAAALSTIDQNVIESDFNMYPVPANDELNIKLNSQVSGSVSYEIVSVMGQSFNKGSVDSNAGGTHIKADISNLADGTYFFVMKVNGTTMTKHFVKMNR